MQQPLDEQSVRHLVELGYADPEKAAARTAAIRRQQDSELRHAADIASLGQLSEAAIVLERLAATDLEWVAPRQLLAEIYYRAGRLDEAQALLDWLTYHGVESPRLSLIAGALALSRRELRSAFDALEYARYVEPNLPSVDMLFGTTLLRLGTIDEAEDAFRQAIESNPGDTRAYAGLAAVSLRNGQFEAAADWALQALEHNMRLFQAHYHLGVALALMNRPQEALQTMEACARVDPKRAAPYYWLTRIAQDQLNDPELAARYCQRRRDAIRQRRDLRQTAGVGSLQQAPHL